MMILWLSPYNSYKKEYLPGSCLLIHPRHYALHKSIPDYHSLCSRLVMVVMLLWINFSLIEQALTWWKKMLRLQLTYVEELTTRCHNFRHEWEATIPVFCEDEPPAFQPPKCMLFIYSKTVQVMTECFLFLHQIGSRITYDEPRE